MSYIHCRVPLFLPIDVRGFSQKCWVSSLARRETFAPLRNATIMLHLDDKVQPNSQRKFVRSGDYTIH